jgi:hypothetical protein
MSVVSGNEKIDFGSEKVDGGWYVVNDGVMGGLSQSRIAFTKDAMIFQGNLSLENNGGFASIRTPWGNYDLSQFNKIVMRIKGDGRNYGFVLSNATRFYLPNYKHDIASKEDKWTTIELPLREFHEEIVGRKTGKMVQEKNLEDVIRMGIILSDKIPGPFKLEIDYIEFQK